MQLEPGDVILYPADFGRYQHSAIAIDHQTVVHADGPRDGQPGFVRIEPMDATERNCGVTFAGQRIPAWVYRCSKGQLAKAAADYARRFGRPASSEAGATQYGQNRGRGVSQASEIGSDLPFEFDAIYRAFKWACGGGQGNDQFSKHQGTTCSAFVIACYQAAAISTMTDEKELIQECLDQLKGFRVDKKATKEARWAEKMVQSSQYGGMIKRTDAYTMKVSNVGPKPYLDFVRDQSSTSVAEYVWEMFHGILREGQPVRKPESYMTDAMKVDAKFCYTQTLAKRLQLDPGHWHPRIYTW